MLIKNEYFSNRNSLEDWRIKGYDPLTPANLLQREYPVSEKGQNMISSARNMISDVLAGKDDRLVVIVGPCFITDPEAALEYAIKLKEVKERLEEQLLVIMRAYLEKPSTTVGSKGLINDSKIDNSFQLNKGLTIYRKMYSKLTDRVPIAAEILDTISFQFLSDFISLGVIGARPTELKLHRELVSNLTFPVGFKNGTNGSVQAAIDAMQNSSESHYFLSVTKPGVASIVGTEGNENTFIILWGSKNGANYDNESVQKTKKELIKAKLINEEKPRPRIMIDCSHENSEKDFRDQPKVVQNIFEQLSQGEDGIYGVIIESNLVDGRQDILKSGNRKDLLFRRSTTEACIGWKTTVELLELLAQGVANKRKILEKKASKV